MVRCRLLASPCALALVLSASAASAEPTATPLAEYEANLARGGEHAPGELLFDVDPSLEPAAARTLVRKSGCTVRRRIPSSPYYIADCPRDRPLKIFLRRGAALEGARWVEASWYDDELEAIPNDLAQLQWYHLNQGQPVDDIAGVRGADMRSTLAWDIVTGSRAQTVAILDVGLYLDHVELRNNRWQNPGETCGNGVDDDMNGYVDDCEGWDIGGDDPDPTPLTLPEQRSDGSSCLRWHGTFIAGLAAAEGDNDIPLAGTAWNVSLMNLKRHRDSSCRSTSTRSTEAVLYAARNGACAIGMSFNTSSRSSSLERALEEAELRGVITVMSAGNRGEDTTRVTRYPNDYRIQNKIIVTASDNRDQLWRGSNYGAGKVDLAAPGDFVVTTGVDAVDGYGAGVGTSMSVGFVLGAVALVKQAFPSLGPGEVRRAILEGVAQKSHLDCAQATRCVRSGGRLDLFGALEAASRLAPPSLSVSAEPTGAPAGPGAQVSFRARVTNGGPGPSHGTRLSLEASGAPLDLPSPSPPARVDPSASAELGPIVAAVRADCAVRGAVPVTVVAEDAFGHRAEALVDVALDCSAPSPDGGGAAPDATAPDAAEATPDAGGSKADLGAGSPDAAPRGDDDGGPGGCRGTPGEARPWLLLLPAILALRARRRSA